MRASFRPFDSDHFPRILQLINKTNQFNLATKRYSESQVQELMRDPDVTTGFVTLADRFGNLGIVSAFIGEIRKSENDKRLIIDTWLMSCRVLQRGVEIFVWTKILNRARELGVKKIVGVYVSTSRNEMVADFYGKLGFVRDPQGQWIYDMDEKTVERNAAHWIADLSLEASVRNP
jgi:FkbH-like protein